MRNKTLFTIVGNVAGYTHIMPYSYSDYSDNEIQFVDLWLDKPQQSGLADHRMEFIEKIKAFFNKCKLMVTTLSPYSRYKTLFCKSRWKFDYSTTCIIKPCVITPSNAGSELTDTKTLIPSQKMLAAMVQDWIFNSCFHEEVDSYLTWLKKEVELGRKIGFLSSIGNL